MDAELKNLKIDRSKRRSAEPSKWATRIIVIGVVLFLLAVLRLAGPAERLAP